MSDTALESFAERRAARETRQRTFEFEGVRFTVRPAIAPDVWVRRHTTAGLLPQELLDLLDESALACLEPDSAKAWAEIRDPNRPLPLTLDDLIWLVDHLIARASGIPTDAPAGSPDGRSNTETSSKEPSPSEADAPTA